MGFDQSGALSEISADLSRIELLADSEAKKVLREAGEVYKKQAGAYSMSTERWKGVGVGARVSVKKSKEGTGYFLVVKGAKGKASLWHLANNGFQHTGANGGFVPGNGFVDKAQIAGDKVADKLIDDAVRKMLGGK